MTHEEDTRRSPTAGGDKRKRGPPDDPLAVAFESGTKVLAYHGPMLYGARVLDVELLAGVNRYYVHYDGWKKKWNEWVTADRLLHDTPENRALQQSLRTANSKKAFAAAAGANKATTGKRGKRSDNESEDAAPSRKRQNTGRGKGATGRGHANNNDDNGEDDEDDEDDDNDEEEGEDGSSSLASHTRPTSSSAATTTTTTNALGGASSSSSTAPALPPLFKIQIPDELKAILVRDWDMIVTKAKLMVLPRTPNVGKILTDFAALKRKPTNADSAVQVSEALGLFFDRALPQLLLYRHERAQYERLFPSRGTSDENDSPSRPRDVYGGEHLLRLFVRLPQLLTEAELDDAEIKALQSRLQEIFKYLVKNFSAVFAGAATGDDGHYASVATSATSSSSSSSSGVETNSGTRETSVAS